MVKFLDIEKIVTFEVNEGNEAFSCYKKKKKKNENEVIIARSTKVHGDKT